MAIFTRFAVAAALVSIALTPVAAASPAEVYGAAQHRARAVHHERAHHINANTGGELRKRSVAKRCAATTSTHTTTSHKTTSTHHSTTTTKKHTTTTKTSSKAVATTKAASVSTSSKKKGIAWSGTNAQLDQFLVNDNIRMIYNWGATPPQPSGVLSCSMLWGTKNVDAFKSARSDYDCLMGPNEFNLAAQSGLSVSEVYSLWKEYIYPYKGQKYLIAPSVTTADTGLSSMQELQKMCPGDDCGWDCVSVHFYGKLASDLIDWTTSFREGLGYPDVCITEWACQAFYDAPGGRNCDSGEVWAMMEAVTAWAEKTSWVKIYTPYGFSEDLGNVQEVNALMSTKGVITDLGKWFLDN